MGDENGGDRKARRDPTAGVDRRRFLGASAVGLAAMTVGRKALAAQPGTREEHAGDQLPESSTPAGGSMSMPEAQVAAKPTSGTTGRAMAMDHAMPPWPPMPKDAPVDRPGAYDEHEIRVQLVNHELVPGVTIHSLGFNGKIPGPVLRAKEGRWQKVTFLNETPLMHTIHWHGFTVPWAMDGVPYVTQPPVHPNQRFVYRFRAEPAGTHFYHCHWGTPLHMHSGMYGAFIVESDDDPIRRAFPYTRDYVLMLSAVDTEFLREELNAMLRRMPKRMKLMREGRLDDRTQAHFKDVGALKAAVAGGYIPPYVRSRRSHARLPEPNFFTINGQCYPATAPIGIKPGETIRVRMANPGFLVHHMHLHGHDFYQVSQDGAPLPKPIRMNTVAVGPGQTVDIVIQGTNPGIWTFHDHDTRRVTNNGLYPGGMLTVLAYEGFDGGYAPSVALDE